MASGKAKTAITQVMDMLAEWDRGAGTSVRAQILSDFIRVNAGKTGPELEVEMAQAASLFLARLTAWLRLTYMVGTCLGPQLKAIGIYLNAASGHRFLAEFLEVGGVMTSLEILGLKQIKDADKTEALKLLLTVAQAGRKYKELICESYGIRAVAECLARVETLNTQQHCRQLLQELAQGNPKYEIQVYKGLIALLPSNSYRAQQLSAQTLRIVQPIVKHAHPNLVEPVLNLLRTLHLEVQFEAIELIKLLMDYVEVKMPLLGGLVGLLVPPKEDKTNRPMIFHDEDKKEILSTPLPYHVQQATACKTIGILAQLDEGDLTETLVQLGCCHGLMVAMANVRHADSQRQASMTLEHIARTFPLVDSAVREAMGEQLYHMFMEEPEALYMRLNDIQIDVLKSNKLPKPHVHKT